MTSSIEPPGYYDPPDDTHCPWCQLCDREETCDHVEVCEECHDQTLHRLCDYHKRMVKDDY